jgi:hypothetical protein
MTTLDAKAGRDAQPTQAPASAPTPIVDPAKDAALITEQQVLFGSAAALAPAPARPHFWSRAAHAVAAPVHAVFTRPEKQSRPRKHYPQRFNYLEASALSREMDRL